MADIEPNSHAAAFCSVECIEERVESVRWKPDTGVTNGQTHAVAALFFGFDQQLSRPFMYAGHRIRGVTEQIEDHLLELNTITCYGRQIVCQFRLNDDGVSLKVVRRERHDLSRGLIQVQPLRQELAFGEQRA